MKWYWWLLIAIAVIVIILFVINKTNKKTKIEPILNQVLPNFSTDPNYMKYLEEFSKIPEGGKCTNYVPEGSQIANKLGTKINGVCVFN